MEQTHKYKIWNYYLGELDVKKIKIPPILKYIVIPMIVIGVALHAYFQIVFNGNYGYDSTPRVHAEKTDVVMVGVKEYKLYREFENPEQAMKDFKEEMSDYLASVEK